MPAKKRQKAVMAPVRTEAQGKEMLDRVTHPETETPAQKVLTAWQMDASLKERAKEYAKAQGHTLTWTLDQALRDYLDKQGF